MTSVVQSVSKSAEILCYAKIVDRIKACVGAKLLVHLLVIVTKSADMKLHSPVKLNVFLSARLKHCSLEGIDLLLGKLLACHTLIKGCLGIANGEWNILKCVIRKTATVIIEVCDTSLYPDNKLLV